MEQKLAPTQEFICAIKDPHYMYLEQQTRYDEVAALARFLGVEGQGEYNMLTKLSHQVTRNTLRKIARKAADMYGELMIADNSRPRSPLSCFIQVAIHDNTVPYSTRLSVFGKKVKKCTNNLLISASL